MILIRCVTISVLLAATSFAATVPFEEDFAASDANWVTAAGLPGLDFFASGGPDGNGYVSDELSFANLSPDDQGPVIFRGDNNFSSSGNAFVGNWITEGVDQFSYWVRHDTFDPSTGAPVPINFFARFASPFNFPGATAPEFVPVLPGVWTELSVDIVDGMVPFGPFVTYEGSDFDTIFSNIGKVQVGVSVPAAVAGLADSFRFDLDRVGIQAVPEPVGPLTTLTGFLAVLMAIGRRRR
jgi:hypothetical protein